MRETRGALWVVLLALLLAAGAAHAVTPEAAEDARTGLPADEPAPAWRPAPIFGGDVRSLVIHPRDPDVVFAGTSAGQVYLSRDGGESWKDAGAHLPFPGWVVGALRFDPNRDPEERPRLWVALWGIWGGGHVAFSDDLGKTWVARAAGLPEEPVYTLALVPGREGHLYAGTLSGVWGTKDAGESWRRLTGDLPEVQKITSLLVDADDPDTVIAGTWRRAYRSADAGRTWAGIFEGMVLDSEVFSLTPIPGKPGEIWATTCGWVYQTKDGGAKWQRFKDGFEERRTPTFAALPDGRLLAGTVAGLHLSADGGRTWRRIGEASLSYHEIVYHPARPERVIFATEGSGVWVSSDGARTMRRSSRGMTNLRVAALVAAKGETLVAVSHGGPISGVYASRDGARTFRTEVSPLPNVLDFAVHAGKVYAATERGLFERRGGEWFRIPELGEGRVEQVLTDGSRLVARTPSALFEAKGGKFVQQTFKHGPPRSAALFKDALWVTDAEGVYRLTEGENHSYASPFKNGRLFRLEDQLLYWGSGGAWTRSGPETFWVKLTDQPSRALLTGDPRHGVVLVSGETVRLYDAEARKFRAIDVPVPARDIASALVVDGRLLLGTSGYGLLVREVG